MRQKKSVLTWSYNKHNLVQVRRRHPQLVALLLVLGRAERELRQRFRRGVLDLVHALLEPKDTNE